MKAFNPAAGARGAPDGQAVSRPELERLEAQRRTPVRERALTPAGAQTIDATLDHHREERIRQIRSRLDEAAGLAVNAHAIGKTRGVAKDGFERSR